MKNLRIVKIKTSKNNRSFLVLLKYKSTLEKLWKEDLIQNWEILSKINKEGSVTTSNFLSFEIILKIEYL